MNVLGLNEEAAQKQAEALLDWRQMGESEFTKEAVASLIIDSQHLLSKNPYAAQLLKIKPQRFKQRLQN